MTTRAHTRAHPINDPDDHLPGTNNTVLGTQASVLAEVPFSTTATINTLALRNGIGDVIVPLTPTSADAAASRQFVEGLVNGINIKQPVQVINLIDDSLSVPPGAPNTGNAYVVGAAPTGAWSVFSEGDIVVWDGAAWQLVLAGSGGSPATGARAVVTGLGSGAGAGSFAGQDRAFAEFDGATWGFTTPIDGDAVLVIGENDPNENLLFVFDSSSNAFVQAAAPTPNHNALAGIQGGIAAERFHLTAAAATEAELKQALITGASDPPVAADAALTSNLTANEEYAFVRDVNNNLYLVLRDSGNFFGVELSQLA